MGNKKPKAPEAVERPELVKGKTQCGNCIYLRGMHPKLLSACKDVYKVKPGSRACKDFVINTKPARYRSHPAISRYNSIPLTRFDNIPCLMEEVKSLAGSVFSKSQTRAGKKIELQRVKEVLRKEQDTSALIPFYEEVQRNRDRVSEIQSLSIMWQGEVTIITEEAEAFILGTFQELRILKPEAVRKATLRSILSEVYTLRVRVDSLHRQCDAALRNFYAQHNALMEIQISARTPVAIPKAALSERRVLGDVIPRGGRRKRNIGK